MHKNIDVANISIDDVTGVISSIGEIYNPHHTPVGISVKKGNIDRGELNKWWVGRAIPASRLGIKQALDTLGVDSTIKLLDKAYGLSLSDQYWIKPKDSDIKWEYINFFENTFSNNIGDILFGANKECANINLLSPNNTSDGWLKKKWTIINETRVLVKSGSGATQQEPYNEAIASAICKRIGIYHIPYSVILQNEYPVSICNNFITKDTELISAWSIFQTAKKPNHKSVYQHYVDCAKTIGIENIVDDLNKMIVLDYIVGNEDRHLNNFGAIRNAQTLEYIGTAPIFDTGTSLWFDKPMGMINDKNNIPCKPFKNSHEEQIKLVTSFDFLDINDLNGIEDKIREITKGSIFVDERRTDAICNGVRTRIEYLASLIRSHTMADDVNADVEKNIAYSGVQEDISMTNIFDQNGNVIPYSGDGAGLEMGE